MNETNQQTNYDPDKIVFRSILGISIFVFLTVILLNRQIIPKPEIIPSWTYLLPKLNAFINGSCTILLLISLYFIKRKNIAAHKRTNIITFCLSSLFLVSYILFHWLAGDTHYPANAPLRGLYFFILITHIILAAGVLPLILLSFYRGLQMQVTKHKKLVRFTYPIWLYVTITGVIVYLMISPYYPV
jgi:putative membrane protein